MTERPTAENDARLTEAESEVVRRWFKGAASEDELREVIAAHFARVYPQYVIPPARPEH